MATSEEIIIPLRVVIDREKNKVVFVEANSDFVDILFSFLTLPMGTIVKLLGNHSGSIGSFNTLFESIANLDAEYFRALEERKLKIGFNEIFNLFRFTIHSKTPLTDMFLGKKQIMSDRVKFEPAPTQETTTTFSKMSVKVLLQKSNSNKVLLAECDEDFIDFLFSFVTIPLGRVVSLLSGNISMSSIENLHTSVLNLNVGRCIKSHVPKDMLLYPRLGWRYLCSNQIFSLLEATTPVSWTLKYPQGVGGFVRGRTMYMVTDGLVVTPLSSMSCFTYLNDLEVPPSDVEEQVINIGMDEALNLLKASLKSTSALTNGLNMILRKIKQEKWSEVLDNSF